MENNNPTINLTFPLDKVQVILNALAEMPYRASAEIIQELHQQASGQLQAPEANPDAKDGAAKK